MVARGSWRRVFSIGSAVLMVLMPKCPFCIIGWLGALGLGGFAAHASIIPTLALVFFCASQGVFLFAAKRTGDARAVVSAALGVAMIVASVFLVDLRALRWVGIGLLATASLLNAVATARRRRALA